MLDKLRRAILAAKVIPSVVKLLKSKESKDSEIYGGAIGCYSWRITVSYNYASNLSLSPYVDDLSRRVQASDSCEKSG